MLRKIKIEMIDISDGRVVCANLEELVSSIEANGLGMPVLVEEYDEEMKEKTGKSFHLLDGHRRLLALKQLKEEEVLCDVR